MTRKQEQYPAQLSFRTEAWAIQRFLAEAPIRFDLNPISNRPDIEANHFGTAEKMSKAQGILNSILRGEDIGEIKMVTAQNPDYDYEVNDGGNRTRDITYYNDKKFPMHELSVIGEKFLHQLSDEDLDRFLNYKLRITFFDNTTPEQNSTMFCSSAKATKISDPEILNSYGDTPIANAVRDTVKGHPLFSRVLTNSKTSPWKYTYFSTSPMRMKFDETVMRLFAIYFANKGKKFTSTSFDVLRDMYDDPNINDTAISKAKKWVDTILDFVMSVAQAKIDKEKSRALTWNEYIMLMRSYIGFNKKFGKWRIPNYSTFWDAFDWGMNSYSKKEPRRKEVIQETKKSAEELIYILFNNHIGEHKTPWKMENSFNWLFEEMMVWCEENQEEVVYKLAANRFFTREQTKIKWQAQKYRCWVTGEPLDFKDAEGGHIIAAINGGTNDYDNLVVIHKDHNRRMQDMNAHDYKEMYLNSIKDAA